MERIPHSALQLLVGTLLSAFGTFWAVEGLGITWPGADLAIIALAAWYILAAAYISQTLDDDGPVSVATHQTLLKTAGRALAGTRSALPG